MIDVASGRAGSGQVISTTGIRGLSAEELKAAKFNEEEMQKLESYTLSANDAQPVSYTHLDVYKRQTLPCEPCK